MPDNDAIKFEAYKQTRFLPMKRENKKLTHIKQHKHYGTEKTSF